jgi:two-component sensor histidine kinase
LRNVRANDALAALTGDTPAEYLGKTPAELFPNLPGTEQVMATMQQILDGGEAQQGVEIQAESLVRDLIHSYHIDPGLIRLTVTSDEVGLGVDMTAWLGIIVNELVSNALKHAFPGNRPGQIEIALRNKGDGR